MPDTICHENVHTFILIKGQEWQACCVCGKQTVKISGWRLVDEVDEVELERIVNDLFLKAYFSFRGYMY